MISIIKKIYSPNISNSHSLYKQLYACSAMSFYLVVLSLPYIFAFYPLSRFLSLVLLGIILMYSGTLVLIKRGFLIFSRIYFFLIVSAAIMFYTTVFSPEIGIQNMFIVLCGVSFMVTIQKEKKIRILLNIIPILSFLCLNFFILNTEIMMRVEMPVEYKKFLYVSFFINICLMIIFVTRYYATAAENSEKYLLDTIEKLQDANSKIDANVVQDMYLRMAKDMQVQFLPIIPKQLKRYSQYAFETIYRPSNQVSGDLYEFFLSGNIIKVFHGDVTGKNAPAMIIAIGIHSTLKRILRKKKSANELMEELNKEITNIRSDRSSCAAFYYEINLDLNILTYVHMGLEDIYILRDGQVLAIGEQGGEQLGYISQLNYDKHSIALQKGDLIVSMSDGIKDMSNKENIRYNENHSIRGLLEKFCDSDNEKSADHLKKFLEQEIDSFHSHSEIYKDDMSVFITGYFTKNAEEIFMLQNGKPEKENLLEVPQNYF
jgi:serine phosphatase RsbU (regulator of sigma subunit)